MAELSRQGVSSARTVGCCQCATSVQQANFDSRCCCFLIFLLPGAQQVRNLPSFDSIERITVN
jgi:hypothetical protein